jgi:hypothetical protein
MRERGLGLLPRIEAFMASPTPRRALTARPAPSPAGKRHGSHSAVRSLFARAASLADMVLGRQTSADEGLPRRDFAFPIDEQTVVLFSRQRKQVAARFGYDHGDVVVRCRGPMKGCKAAIVGERGGSLWAVKVCSQRDVDAAGDGTEDVATTITRQGTFSEMFIDADFPTAFELEGSDFESINERNDFAPIGARVALMAAPVIVVDDAGSERPSFNAPLSSGIAVGSHATDSPIRAATAQDAALRVTSEHLTFLQAAPDLLLTLDVPSAVEGSSSSSHARATRTVHLVPTLQPVRGKVGWAAAAVVRDASESVFIGVDASAFSLDALPRTPLL